MKACVHALLLPLMLATCTLVAPGAEQVAAPTPAPSAYVFPTPVPVTSMRQAYEILGLPPGRISIENVTKAYRELQSQYHPDRVAHLGPEFQELAAMKALQFNLAMQFIKNNSG